MKAFLRKLNGALEGFRGLIAIWAPIGAFFLDSVMGGLVNLSKEGIKTAAMLAVIPTVKLIYTDALPKMKALYLTWLNKD